MVIRNQCLNPVSVPQVTGIVGRILRCGQCPNCLRQKKNELSVRTIRETLGKKIGFLTFTYEDKYMPVQVTDFVVDKDTGEYVVKSFIERESDFFDNAPFRYVVNKSGKKSKKYGLYSQETDFGFRYKYHTTYYEDLKLAIKRFRVKYPDRLKTFIAVPEYGGLTYRPHFHMLCVGLTNDELQALANEWHYGFVDVDTCDRKDKSNDPAKIGAYISKYCTKGKYDCPHIKEGFCVKPRRCVSQNFGCGDEVSFEALKDMLLCKSQLNISDPWSEFDSELSDEDLHLLASRRFYDVNQYSYPMPKYLINKVFKKVIKSVTYYDSSGQKRVAIFSCPLSGLDRQRLETIREADPSATTRYHQVSSPLQRKISLVVLADLVSDFGRKQEQYKRFYSANSEGVCCEENIQNDSEIALQTVEKSFKQDLENSSIF